MAAVSTLIFSFFIICDGAFLPNTFIITFCYNKALYLLKQQQNTPLFSHNYSCGYIVQNVFHKSQFVKIQSRKVKKKGFRLHAYFIWFVLSPLSQTLVPLRGKHPASMVSEFLFNIESSCWTKCMESGWIPPEKTSVASMRT